MKSESDTKTEAESHEIVKRPLSKDEVEAAKWLAQAGGHAPDLKYVPRRQSETGDDTR